jgi:hypothetical protein
MLRIIAIVGAFVGLNTGGFVAYRAFQPDHAAPVPPAASEATISRPPPTIQPKPSETAHSPEADRPQQVFADPIVSKPTPAVEEKPPTRTPARTRVRHTTQSPPTKPKLKESLIPPQSPSPSKNRLLEMEANPYKRGE